jgi:RNA polymerase sigma-70 factor, ECF subfamily
MRAEDFEQLFDRHAQPLFAFLVYRTGDRILAEDIVASTFERALRARRQFKRRRGSEKNWLYAIALNLLRDNVRRAEAEARSLERIGEQSVAADSVEGAVADRDMIRRALEILSPEERDAIALRYGGDLTVPEIAELTGERLTTIDGRVYRALRKLRNELTSRPEPAADR